MSAESMWDVQAGVYAWLAASSGLTGLLPAGAGGVLDHVPEGTAFPYVVIGECAFRPLDTQAGRGADVTISIHSYSRATGMQELRRIMAAVYDALHEAAFAVPNQALVLCRCLGGDSAAEGDGLTRHGVQRFQIITEPA